VSKKTYVILGGGGSFGIHTAFYLLEQGHNVVGIGRNPLRPEPFSLGIERQPNYRYIARHIGHELDLLLYDFDEIQPDIIVNFAAQGEGAISWNNSWRFFDTNATALVRLCEELRPRSWFQHFIQIGTSEIYGSVDHAVTEEAPIKPTSPYAASKVAFDLYLLSVSKTLGFPMTILRPCNAYCPGQLLHRVIPKAIVCGLTGRKLPLQGGGRAEKSYIHARDLARAIALVSDSALGNVYNVGASTPVSIAYIVNLCADAIGLTMEDLCEITDDRLGQDSRYWLDSSKIKNDFGWEPIISLPTGIDTVVAWARKYLDQLRDWPMDYVLRA
jgi:dTDP-glucose 4,6-dehydratase